MKGRDLKYLEKSQYLALICEPSVDAHLLHLRNQNLTFLIIMMVMVIMFKITVMTVLSMAMIYQNSYLLAQKRQRRGKPARCKILEVRRDISLQILATGSSLAELEKVGC